MPYFLLFALNSPLLWIAGVILQPGERIVVQDDFPNRTSINQSKCSYHLIPVSADRLVEMLLAAFIRNFQVAIVTVSFEPQSNSVCNRHLRLERSSCDPSRWWLARTFTWPDNNSAATEQPDVTGCNGANIIDENLECNSLYTNMLLVVESCNPRRKVELQLYLSICIEFWYSAFKVYLTKALA